MIFVILGTQDKKFPRLLDAIQNQIDCGNIDKSEEIIVQAGSTKYESKDMKIRNYIGVSEFNELLDKADLIICHAGVGTIISALNKNKTIIAAARLKKYGEHVNDHQLQILENFSKKGYLLALSDFDKLNELIEKSKTFKPAKFESNTKNFIKKLEEEIEES